MPEADKTKRVTMDDITKYIDDAVAKSAEASSVEFAKQMGEMNGEIRGVTKAIKSQTKDTGINQTRLILAEIQLNKQIAGGTTVADRNEALVAILEKNYGKRDPEFVREMREIQKDLAAGGNGGVLINEDYMQGFLSQLWNGSLIADLGVNFLPTSTGNLTISKVVEGVSAGYVGEMGTIKTSTIKFGHLRLAVKKMQALVPISNDLIRYARLDVEKMVQDQLFKEMAQVGSHALLYGKGETYEPRGILNTPGILVAKGDVAGMSLGIEMKAEIGKKNHLMTDLHWVMGWETYKKLCEETRGSNLVNYTELQSGKWLGIPFHLTNLIENKSNKEDLVLVKASEITAIEGLKFEIANSAHASFDTADGTINAFTQDMTLVRGQIEHDFLLNYGSAAVKAVVDLTK